MASIPISRTVLSNRNETYYRRLLRNFDTTMYISHQFLHLSLRRYLPTQSHLEVSAGLEKYRFWRVNAHQSLNSDKSSLSFGTGCVYLKFVRLILCRFCRCRPFSCPACQTMENLSLLFVGQLHFPVQLLLDRPSGSCCLYLQALHHYYYCPSQTNQRGLSSSSSSFSFSFPSCRSYCRVVSFDRCTFYFIFTLPLNLPCYIFTCQGHILFLSSNTTMSITLMPPGVLALDNTIQRTV